MTYSDTLLAPALLAAVAIILIRIYVEIHPGWFLGFVMGRLAISRSENCVIRHFVSSRWLLSVLWLAVTAPHKIEPVLFFPQAFVVAARQPKTFCGVTSGSHIGQFFSLFVIAVAWCVALFCCMCTRMYQFLWSVAVIIKCVCGETEGQVSSFVVPWFFKYISLVSLSHLVLSTGKSVSLGPLGTMLDSKSVSLGPLSITVVLCHLVL